jgi:hypothetical protein
MSQMAMFQFFSPINRFPQQFCYTNRSEIYQPPASFQKPKLIFKTTAARRVKERDPDF